jgi:hypothetical protein
LDTFAPLKAVLVGRELQGGQQLSKIRDNAPSSIRYTGNVGIPCDNLEAVLPCLGCLSAVFFLND